MFWSVEYWTIQDSFIKFDLSSSISFARPKFYSQHFVTESFGFAQAQEDLEVDIVIQLEISLDLEVDIFTKRFSALSGRSSSPEESSRSATPPSRRGGTRDWLSGS